MNIDFLSPEIIISIFLFLSIPFACLLIKSVLKKSKPSLLKRGDVAPYFDLMGALGRQTKLSQYRGKNIVLVFYPEGHTIESTKQLTFLRDQYNQFQLLETEVIAITGLVLRGAPGGHSKGWHFQDLENYVRKHNINYPVLVDQDGEVSRAYGSSGYFGLTLVSKAVFIIDKQGIIQWASSGLNSCGDLISKIQQLD